MRLHLWLAYRFLASSRRFLNLPAMTSLIGMALGVASLTVAMGVVSGFESALRLAIIDVFGDVMVVRRVDKPQSLDATLSKIKEVAPEAKTFTPFVNLEGIVTGDGKLAGIMIQGFDPKTVEQVLNIRPRVIRGEFSFRTATADRPALAMVGKALAKKFGLEVGQVFRVVLPMPSRKNSSGFAPKVMSFELAGVLDLGKIEFDERYIVTDLRTAQFFGGVGDGFTGIRVKLEDSNQAGSVATRLANQLGPGYWTMDWSEVSKNLFEAVKIERVAIFFCILIMVVAACFNISSNLFVSVLKKYADIATLRAMGFSARDVTKVFVAQGLFFGSVGTAIGLILGLILCGAFVVLQRYVVLLPVDTYKIDHVGIELRFLDLLLIVVAALLICLLSTLVPARRGAKLDPVEGLRYD